MDPFKALSVSSLLLVTLALSACSSGSCDYPDDRARDGSRCGDRAASVRPGGRNPDTDWIFWVLIGGGALYFLTRSSGGGPSSPSSPPPRREPTMRRPLSSESVSKNSAPTPPPKPEPTPLPKDEPLTSTASLSTPDSSADDSNECERSEVDPAKVKAILRMTFDQVVEPYLFPMFNGVCAQTAELGGTDYDAAARFILANIGSFQDIPGDNITRYIDVQTRNLHLNMHRQTLHTDVLSAGITIIRASRGLVPL